MRSPAPVISMPVTVAPSRRASAIDARVALGHLEDRGAAVHRLCRVGEGESTRSGRDAPSAPSPKHDGGQVDVAVAEVAQLHPTDDPVRLLVADRPVTNRSAGAPRIRPVGNRSLHVVPRRGILVGHPFVDVVRGQLTQQDHVVAQQQCHGDIMCTSAFGNLGGIRRSIRDDSVAGRSVDIGQATRLNRTVGCWPGSCLGAQGW